MISNIQERLAAIPQAPLLQDGLAVYDILKEVDAKIDELSHRTFDTTKVRRESERTIILLKKIKEKALSSGALSENHAIVKKWIEAGYDRSFILSDPESVSFFGTADFRAIRLFKKNKKLQLEYSDMGLHFDHAHGKVLFKVQGKWKLFSDFKDQVPYDVKDKKLRGWSYVYPDGLTPKDATDWTALSPFAKLPARIHRALKRVAHPFWPPSQQKKDWGVDKPCILQIFVRETKHPNAGLLQNARRMLLPTHCFVRLIDSERNLYSCNGYWAPIKEQERLFKKSCLPCSLQTVNANIQVIDSEEFDAFHADSVSIPLSTKTFLQIKERVEAINKNGGFRFSLTTGNCCHQVQEILELAGVHIDTRLALSEILSLSLPRASDVPYVGRGLTACSRVASSLLPIIPAPLKTFFSWAGRAGLFIPKKACAVLSSVPLIALGAAQGSPMTKSQQAIPIGADFKRKRVIGSLSDIFKPHVIFHSEILRSWIQQQRSYQELDQTSGLCVVKL